MSLSADYAAAMFPDPVRILGVRLRPYCIGHALLLQRIGSPYVAEDGGRRTESGLGDLFMALWICSQPWDQAEARLRSRRARWLLKWWSWQFHQQPDTQAALAFVCAETQLFRYIGHAWRGPTLWEKQRTGPVETPGAPLLAHLKVTLMSSLHCSQHQALSWPVRAALFDYATHAERAGQVGIVSEEDESAVDECIRRNARN
jgi:hypothetical protein